MNLQEFKKFIPEFAPISIILDEKEDIIWKSKEVKDKFNLRCLSGDLNINEIKKRGQVKIKIGNIRYLGKIKRINFEEDEGTLFLDELNSMPMNM